MGIRTLFTSKRKPWGLRWRSSVAFITTVVGFGITTDLLVYSLIIPVLPFQLERLGHTRVSSLTGWLLCAYSAGLVLSTIPIAMYSERHSSRRISFIMGLIALLGSQIMFMEAPNYALMAVARVLQGISSSVAWVVGLALLCDTAPENNIGRQLGIAMTGLSVGLLVGSPAGGALYLRYGFRAPFIFGEICTAVDLVLRLLIVERGIALKWGYDPSTASAVAPDAIASHIQLSTTPSTHPNTNLETDANKLEQSITPNLMFLVQKPNSLLSVIARLSRSPRALVALTMAFVYGMVNSMQEPSLPLHLQSVWGFNSDQVGIIYLAAVVPALISSPLAGYLSDKNGTDYLTCICLLLAWPWWIVMTLRRSFPLFVVALALQSFFVSGVVAPVTAELAAVSRNMVGVGYAHIYGAFNIAFGIGTAVGPVIGGQIYDHTRHGWTAICCMTAALIIICVTLAFCFTGADPVLAKVLRQHHPHEAAKMRDIEESSVSEHAVASVE